MRATKCIGIHKVSLIAILTLVVPIIKAHEFWLLPRKYIYQPGESVNIDLMVGENFTGEFWDLHRHKVVRASVHQQQRVTDLTTRVQSTAGNNLQYTLPTEGTYLFALQSNAAYLELDAAKFEEYLKEDGIEDILTLRAQKNQSTKPSREFYTRYAKLLVQAGRATTDTYKKTLGLRYEVVPMSNPYTLRAGDYLTCLLLWEGKPSAHTMVKVWNKVEGKTFLQNIYTENDGTLVFPISNPGPWMVSSVRMVESGKPEADYESSWASLVFEIGK
jgi:uncharacterized GH25 family protein